MAPMRVMGGSMGSVLTASVTYAGKSASTAITIPAVTGTNPETFELSWDAPRLVASYTTVASYFYGSPVGWGSYQDHSLPSPRNVIMGYAVPPDEVANSFEETLAKATYPNLSVQDGKWRWPLDLHSNYSGMIASQAGTDQHDFIDEYGSLCVLTGKRIDQRRVRLMSNVKLPQGHTLKCLVIKETDFWDDAPEIPLQVEVLKTIDCVIFPNVNISDVIDVETAVAGPNSTVSIRLLPIEVYSDLNNDGQTNSGDSGLTGKPYASGASDDEKDKGTEFIFANDSLSNGAWDKDDDDTPGKPGDADDDDAEPIIVGIGSLPNQTEVWLEHHASAGLKFYSDKKCTQEIHLSSSQHHIVGGSATWPADNKVYVRAESVTFSSTTNPQVEGDLKLMIKPTGGAAAGIEAAKMKLTIIKDIGATKYFHGARDYMLEQNARLHVRFFNAGSHQIRITAMRHESTDMGVIETYHRNPKIYGMPDVVAKNQDHYDLILNGNFCFFDGGTAGRLWGIANHQMTPRCHGGCVVGGAQNAATSVGGSNPFEQPNAEYLSANGKGTFAIATGVVPLTPPAHQAALGGFASNLVGGTYNIHPWFGLAETGSATDKKKLIFTVTQTAATTQYPVADLAARLTASGQTLCVAGDGGSSTAIAHRIEGDSTRVKFAGGKHYAGHYWINTYVGFKSDKPRP
jgi:hypothetical protein